MAHNDRKAVSQFPHPPRRYYHNCATDRPTPPPPPHATAAYSMFGREYTSDAIEPTLEQAGRRRLYDESKPPTEELRRLNALLLQLFLRLVKSLCYPPPMTADPAPHDGLVRTIEDVFVNMQYLVNVMRPAQAAMELKTLLDRQTQSRKLMTSKLNDSVARAWHLVSDAADNLSRKSSVQLSPMCFAPLDTLVNSRVSTSLPPDHPDLSRPPLLDDDDDEDIHDDDDDVIKHPKPSTEQVLARMAQLAADHTL